MSFLLLLESLAHMEMVASISFYNAAQLEIPRVKKKDPNDLPSLSLFILCRYVSSLKKQLAAAIVRFKEGRMGELKSELE